MAVPIAAIASLASSSLGQYYNDKIAAQGLETNAEILKQARDLRSAIGQDTAARNDPYYKMGLAQLPSITGMSSDPDFSVTGRAPDTQVPTFGIMGAANRAAGGGTTVRGAEYGDKYSKGAADMVLGGPRNNLISLAELNSNFNRSEQPRLLNRRKDLLQIGYGNTNTAGQDLMQTGTSLANISQDIGNIEAANARQTGNARQNLVNDTLQGASYAPLYAYNRKQNGGSGWL